MDALQGVPNSTSPVASAANCTVLGVSCWMNAIQGVWNSTSPSLAANCMVSVVLKGYYYMEVHLLSSIGNRDPFRHCALPSKLPHVSETY